MRLTLYLRQARELIRQNKLFSGLYMAGTALAIAMTTTMAVIYYVKLAPVAPDVNREHMSIITSARYRIKDQQMSWGFSYEFVEKYLRTLKNTEVVSAKKMVNNTGFDWIQLSDGRPDVPVEVSFVDTEYFRVYEYRFLEGRAFTREEFDNGTHTVVLSDRMARRVFGQTTGIVGRHLTFNNVDYQVCGIIEEPSYLAGGFAQMLVPFTSQSDYLNKPYAKEGCDCLGSYSVWFITRDDAQEAALRQEINALIERINHADPDGNELSLGRNQPYNLNYAELYELLREEPTPWAVVRYVGTILLVLLLVPALNMSAMISGRMEMRLAEMGVRKAFGASKVQLLSQVLWENLLLTLLGGILGLLLSWMMVYGFRDWIFSLFSNFTTEIPEGVDVTVTGEMLFAAPIFLEALVCIVLLNLLSAFLPAWSALRKPIVYSLMQKR